MAGSGSSRTAVEEAVASELSRHGANRVAIAGILGNAWRESRMDPAAEGTGGGGLWGFTSGAISLANLKRAGGGRWRDPTFQTDFMLAHGGQGLIGKLNQQKTPAAAARVFMEEWERPGIPALPEREAGARYAFGHLGRTPLPSKVPGGSGQPKESPPHESSSLGSDLMHVGLTGVLVLGGAGMVGLGITRLFGSAQKRGQAA